MTTYHLHLANSTGPTGDADSHNFVDDEQAVREAAAAAGEVLLSELLEGCPTPRATVTVQRDKKTIAVVRAEATIERMG